MKSILSLLFVAMLALATGCDNKADDTKKTDTTSAEADHDHEDGDHDHEEGEDHK